MKKKEDHANKIWKLFWKEAEKVVPDSSWTIFVLRHITNYPSFIAEDKYQGFLKEIQVNLMKSRLIINFSGRKGGF